MIIDLWLMKRMHFIIKMIVFILLLGLFKLQDCRELSLRWGICPPFLI